MQISKHKVVAIDYLLTNDAGEVLDRSQEGTPLMYVHGVGAIIPGLESELEGKSPGDRIEVTVLPEQAYGPRNESLQQEVDRDHFADVTDLEVGMQFRVPTQDGQDAVITVVEINDDTVTVDGNHELAGVTLNFDVSVRDVRDATEEEIAHGHVHGPGGHQH